MADSNNIFGNQDDTLYRRIPVFTDPDDRMYHDKNLGDILWQRGSYAQAEESYRRHEGTLQEHRICAEIGQDNFQPNECVADLGVDRENPFSHYDLGLLLRKLGKVEEALKCFKIAKALNSSNPLFDQAV